MLNGFVSKLISNKDLDMQIYFLQSYVVFSKIFLEQLYHSELNIHEARNAEGGQELLNSGLPILLGLPFIHDLLQNSSPSLFSPKFVKTFCL